jgi:hypothetical protein
MEVLAGARDEAREMKPRGLLGRCALLRFDPIALGAGLRLPVLAGGALHLNKLQALMTRAWCGAVVAFSAVAAVALSGAAASASTPGGCGKPTAHVVFRGGGDLVVRMPTGAYDSDGATYACRAAKPTRRFLVDKGNVYQDPDGNVHVGPFATHGSTLALGLAYDDGGGFLEVIDLADRRKIAEPSATPSSDTSLADPYVVSVVLASPSEYAWVASGELEPKIVSYTYQVLAHDATGVKVLDTSPKIKPKSLASAAGIVTWTDGTTAMTAPL